MILSALKVLIPTLISFSIGIIITPILSNFMYKHKMWKRKSRSLENTDAMSEAFKHIHNQTAELGTPRVGGVIVWLSILITLILTFCLSYFANEFVNDTHIITHNLLDRLNFISRNQTSLLIFALIGGSVFGLIDDLLQIYGKDFHMSDGVPRKLRILFVILIASFGSYWFFDKLGMNSIHIPFVGELMLGYLFIPLFIGTVFVTFSGGVIDGIDGLASGVMICAFAAYTLIAFAGRQYDLAALGGTIIGGLLAFLWFNVPPARFYLGETGMLGISMVLAMFAFLTREVLVLIIVALPLIITSLSSFIQINSKKYFHKKIFRIAPLHHHFQAMGWSSAKVVMRYWIVSAICGVVGVIIALLG